MDIDRICIFLKIIFFKKKKKNVIFKICIYIGFVIIGLEDLF